MRKVILRETFDDLIFAVEKGRKLIEEVQKTSPYLFQKRVAEMGASDIVKALSSLLALYNQQGEENDTCK